MAAHTVAPEPQTGKLAFRSRHDHRMKLGKISKATELRLINSDPDHPKPIPMPPGGQSKAYVESESDAYLELVLARQRQNGGG